MSGSSGPLYILRGLRYNFHRSIVFLSSKIDFVLANSADPDEMPHNAAFNLGLHCLLKYSLWGLCGGLWSTKG